MKNIWNIKRALFAIVLLGVIIFLLYTNIPDFNHTAQIVFTTDSKYQDYSKVAIKSAIENKNPESVYNITVLCVDLLPKDMDKIKSMETKNVSINTIPVTLESIKDIGNYPVHNGVSRADLFKFLMPEILKQYDKVLYLDSDIIVRGDLLKLYNTNIKMHYLGAVRRYGIVYTYTPLIEYKGHTLYAPWATYVYNCGVLLLNLKNMRNDNIPLKLIEAKEQDKERALMTQSAFNKVIPDFWIKKLDPKYNTVSRWRDFEFDYLQFKKTYFPYLIFTNSMSQMREKAVIAHFAGKVKPWNNPDIYFGGEWLKYAKMTGIR